MKESNLRKTFMPIWQAANGKLSKLFRNNTGGYKAPSGQWVFYGIGLWRRKNKKSPYRPVGGGDLIGWTTKEIASRCCGSCEEFMMGCKKIESKMNTLKYNLEYYNLIQDVCDEYKPRNGKNYAIFTSIELKTKGVPETQDQKDWKKLVLESGGIAEVVKE